MVNQDSFQMIKQQAWSSWKQFLAQIGPGLESGNTLSVLFSWESKVLYVHNSNLTVMAKMSSA